ncbi:MAG: NUDIX hydrolase [Cyanobacteriota bacterium]|nr:NUDIX hydrolase [Cyanobacteriota bacterium]
MDGGVMVEIESRNRVFATPWFEVVAKSLNSRDSDAPYYALELPDYSVVVALTPERKILFVRQYRPAVEQYTLELPSGHIDSGESPEEAARRELLEETGYTAGTMEFLGCLMPDAGRLSNRLWCYFTADVALETPHPVLEAGIEVVTYTPQDFAQLLNEGQFDHALHMAPILLAILKGKLVLSIN